MNAQALLLKYIQNSEKVFAEIEFKRDLRIQDREKATEVIEYAKRYLSDAKFYGEKQQYETGLVSVAYCEGMLDALRLLGMVEFTWPNKGKKQ